MIGARPTAWIVTDGKIGMVNQCLGLAEAVAERVPLDIVAKTVNLREPWRTLSPYLRIGGLKALATDGDRLDPPYPALLIGCGRQSILPSIAVRQASQGRTLTVQIQDPAVSTRHFDLVAAPVHDGLEGPNVIATLGAVHRVTPGKLKAAVERAAGRLAHLPRPLVAVLIGGDNGVYRLSPARMGDIAEQLSILAKRDGAGLLVTASRRTGADNEAILRARLKDLPVEIWDGKGDNPYFAYLGLADHVLVTVDSVNMVSEAASTGKPVQTIALDAAGPGAKFDAFHDSLRKAGVTRPFEGRLETWSYAPLDDTARVAERVVELLKGRGVASTAERPRRHEGSAGSLGGLAVDEPGGAVARRAADR